MEKKLKGTRSSVERKTTTIEELLKVAERRYEEI